MLVLSRRRGESLTIHVDAPCVLTLTLVDILNRRASLGFEAPPAARILRGELLPPSASPSPEIDHAQENPTGPAAG